MNKDVSQFAEAVKRLRLFSGLQPNQAALILRVCERRNLTSGETLCQFGDRSDQMYILLSGSLSASISPLAPVGEMGMFTDEPRSATVVAAEDSALFVLGKYQLEGVMRKNKDIEVTVSRNVIATLAARIRQSNDELNHLWGLIADQGAPPEDDDEEAYRA